jgi:ABC-type multidrug transport system fused ATPase/permease subunit
LFDSENARIVEVDYGVVKFEDVGFLYGLGKLALSNVNFETPSQGLVGAVREIGSGKSTILSLLVRFWDVTFGSITIGGKDIRSFTLDFLRKNIGVVMQVASFLGPY